jgi:5-methylthioribose kinase
MTFWLSSQNVFEYLNKYNLCTQADKDLSQIEQKVAKNFNLILSLADDRKLLVKQERYSPDGKTTDEFVNEWRIQEFIQEFPELDRLQPFLPEVLYFDPQHSIIISHYLTDYRDLFDFYLRENIFANASAQQNHVESIAAAVGQVLADIHRATLERQDYRDFFTPTPDRIPAGHPLHVIRRLAKVTPEIFGLVPSDGLKFFSLYQRYESLQTAIAELIAAYDPCCLTHNDMKLNNILLYQQWQQVLAGNLSDPMVRFIDWERCAWGDPAFDLGMLVGNYLLLWLTSLVVSKTIAIEDSLRMAIIPLENLQPSMAALVKAYFQQFPEILERRPDFLLRTIQFAGIALLMQIQSTLQNSKVFGNTGICMLQVAKGLLCRPEPSIATVFGITAAQVTGLHPAMA